MDFPSEVVWSLAITGLIGLWLIWQSVMIAYQVNIFSIFVHWLKKNFIIVPSILFLITPFLLPYLIRQISAPYTELNFKLFPGEANVSVFSKSLSKLILPPLDRALTIFATAASIFIGNRYLDGFRKQQEQKKIAKLLILTVEEHLKSFDEVFNSLAQKSIVLPKLLDIFVREINYIKNDRIYELVVQQIGLLDLRYVDFIPRYTRYSKVLNSMLEEISVNFNRDQDAALISALKVFAIEKYMILKLEAQLFILFLSKKVLQDQDNFYAYKESVKKDYTEARRYIENFKVNLEFNPEIAVVLKRTEELFEEFGLRAELEDTYNQKKIELKNE